ncbi:hypothetical protein [Aurantibacillus circumpalustris]|uniref:hypothetical protein n=1 Tax=Aurantibacillus circumpalustris TaxID=3036359 RepID=UPI00295A5F44|nr:hypothetical protein [Aurantibacillus circumpalustris]
MLVDTVKYKFSNYSIFLTVVLSVGISWFYKWNYTDYPLDFMGGDAKDYYSGLVSIFITHDFTSQTGNDWFLLKTNSGTINVHPIGVSVLLLPFFAIASLLAGVFNFPMDGFSFPFQLLVAIGALVYAVIGLVYIRKLFQLHNIGDKTSSIIILLVFFGTNLLNYTLSEAGLSHVYSFSLISIFLYHSSKFVLQRENKNLLSAFLILGLIVLVRPNNILILLTIFMWFKSFEECKQFFRDLFKNKAFYKASLLAISIVLVQSLVWFIQSKSFFHNTYKADGFYWLNPQILKMLFGFDGGFFIYSPICFLFLLGLIFLFRENKFSFISTSLFLLGLFYFFASYWAYNYFDGFGIRVLVDYYALFSFIGAKLFTHFLGKTLIYNSIVFISTLLLFVNLIYSYQANRNILLRAGMTFNKWKYIFLKTSSEYQNVLGGSNELTPYSSKKQEVVLTSEIPINEAFNFSQKEYGPTLHFDSIGFHSRRIQLKINCKRQELFLNASKDALLCVALEDGETHEGKSYTQFKLNETPAIDCCDEREYNYTANITADFKPKDKLSVYIWNIKQQAFLLNKLSVNVYNYNFQIN